MMSGRLNGTFQRSSRREARRYVSVNENATGAIVRSTSETKTSVPDSRRPVERVPAHGKGSRVLARIILLGLPTSGKSTISKCFQAYFAPKALKSELAAWRLVIRLTVVSTITRLMDLLGRKNQGQTPSPTQGTEELRRLMDRLSRLPRIERELSNRLRRERGTFDYRNRSSSITVSGGIGGSHWKSLAERKPNGRIDQVLEVLWQWLDICANDMESLWLAHAHVLRKPQPLMKQVGRIAACGYLPTLRDVLQAHVRTEDIEARSLIVEKAPYLSDEHFDQEVAIYDIGGKVDFRDGSGSHMNDVTCAIFVIDVSSFGKFRGSSDNVTLLDDGLTAWAEVCQNDGLVGKNLVVLLNKSDLLETKLAAGLQFADYVVDYGSRPNNASSVMSYIKERIIAIYRGVSPRPHRLQMHVTCGIDISSVAQVFGNMDFFPESFHIPRDGFRLFDDIVVEDDPFSDLFRED